MIRAIYFPDYMEEFFEQHRTPGAFMLEPLDAAGRFTFIYFCPCGCGRKGELFIGENFKPGGDRPSWRWNGSRTEPTFDPSVNHGDHWHGWLRNGYWVTS